MIRKLIDRWFNPGRRMAKMRQRQERQFIRETTDRLRADMGMEPVDWERLA